MSSCRLGQLSDTNTKLWECSKENMLHLKEKGKKHCMNCGQHLWTEIDFTYCTVPPSFDLHSLQWWTSSETLSETPNPHFVVCAIELFLQSSWEKRLSEMRIYFHAKGSSDFHYVSLVDLPCCSWGGLALAEKTNTAFLTLLPMGHLKKVHFLLIHINLSGGITEADNHLNTGFGLCEKESLLQWSFVSEFGQLLLFWVHRKAEEAAEKWGWDKESQVEESLDVITCRQPPPLCINALALGFIMSFPCFS